MIPVRLAAAALVSQVIRHERVGANLMHFFAFSVGTGLLLLTKVLLE